MMVSKEILDFVTADDDKLAATLSVDAGETSAVLDLIHESRKDIILEAVASRLGSLVHVNRAQAASLFGISEKLSSLSAASDERKLPKATQGEMLQGDVAAHQFVDAVSGFTYNRRSVGKAWGKVVNLTARTLFNYSQSDAPLMDVLTPAKNVELNRGGYEVSNDYQCTVDASVFSTLVDYVDSFGPHYTNQLEALKTLDVQRQDYTLFMIWKDVASRCAPAAVEPDQEPGKLGEA